MIQMLDPPRSLGFIKKRLAFLVEKQKKINGTFSIISRRNLRGLWCVRIFWGTIQILDKARILCFWIGFAATIDDQYAAALDKFSRALQDFSAMRPRWSLAMRIAIANSFMLSLFSFVSRFFFMPTRILQQIENRVLPFLSKVPFT